MNLVMQLRKGGLNARNQHKLANVYSVTCHPYLFDGAVGNSQDLVGSKLNIT